MELPSHPETDENGEHPPATTTSRATRTIAIATVALVTAILLLHLTGIVGPAAK